MRIFHSKQPAVEAGIALANALRAAHAHPILVMVSGGSAFSILDSVPSEVL